MTQAQKMAMFNIMLELEKEDDNAVRAEGAFKMLEALGLGSEYINWSIGR